MESVTENQVPMEDKLAARFAELEEKIKNMPQEEQDRVRDAYTYAKEHHDGQLRKDGSPYITHPLEVAHLVADLGLDADSIIAALLHDTIEDTDATHEEVAKRFGVTVANLVEGVTKLNKVKYTSTEEKQMENLRKMLMAMAQDVRVILIKICDRVHNIRTLEYQSEKKQREKALETLEIYAPIAHRLGMGDGGRVPPLPGPCGLQRNFGRAGGPGQGPRRLYGADPKRDPGPPEKRGHQGHGLRAGEARLLHLPEDVRPEQKAQ